MFKLFSRGMKETDNLSTISFYDTESKAKKVFQALNKKNVTMYSCGPTVYDHIHIGNLRAYLLPDLIKRVLMYNGYKVEHTINFTDFGHLSGDDDTGEDKIMKGMKREGYPITIEGMRDFVLPYIESFKRDNIEFGNLNADHYARASDYIKEQVKLIETLTQKGYTYEISDGIYFDIQKFPKYGKLTNLDISKMKAGARVEVNKEKKHPADFALWKKADLGFESKWGTGFPGWHIECTAMAFATLGKQIDIHTGGEDLAHTHHNGEIAQAEAVTGKKFVQYWLHNAFVTMSDAKMAKSEGNGMTLSDLVALGYHPEDYRYWLLQSHYRTQASFSLPTLDASKQALTRLKRYVYEELGSQKIAIPDEGYENAFVEAVNDDIDTPKAIALLWDLVKDDSIQPAVKLATIHAIDSVLEIGLSLSAFDGLEELGHLVATDLDQDILDLIEKRDLARAGRNWDQSDMIREELKLKGYAVEDTPQGTKVSKL